jgi:hypothetical protein
MFGIRDALGKYCQELFHGPSNYRRIPPPIHPKSSRLAQQARALILDTIPGVLEMVDPPSKIIAYGYSPKYADLVCAIAPYASHVNLIFSRGAELPDPEGLLAGTGKRARHVKFTNLGDIQRPAVRALITVAVALTKPAEQS